MVCTVMSTGYHSKLVTIVTSLNGSAYCFKIASTIERNYTHTHAHTHTHTHTVLESRIGDGLQQLEQDCHRLQIFAQKQPPTQRQAARK